MQKPQQYGFTLIEIMIVLVIIAIMSGVVVLNVSSSNYAGFTAEGVKIASELEILADEAVYTNSVIVCDVTTDGFTCQSYKNGDWSELNIRKLISWGWPRNIQIISTIINGRPIKDGEKIRFYPSGDIVPMSFQFSDGTHKAWVDGNMDGVFVVNN